MKRKGVALPYLEKQKCPPLSQQRGCLSVEVGKSSFGWKVGGHRSIGWVPWWRKWGRCGRVLVPSPVDGVQWGSLPPSCSNTHHPASRAPIQLHLCPHLTQFGFHVTMFLVIFTGTKVLKRMKVFVWWWWWHWTAARFPTSSPSAQSPGSQLHCFRGWFIGGMFANRDKKIFPPALWRRIRGNYVPSGKTHLKHAARAAGRAQPDKWECIVAAPISCKDRFAVDKRGGS